MEDLEDLKMEVISFILTASVSDEASAARLYWSLGNSKGVDETST